MEKEEEKVRSHQEEIADANEEREALELVLFQVSECYVYLVVLIPHIRKLSEEIDAVVTHDTAVLQKSIPPRKTAASYRADEWDVNKWVWEGTLKVVSKGEECIIKLEDKSTGELYARAFLRNGEVHPVEAVIDSSRYFVLRIEENIGGRLRHAFIGIGFRERTEAYDFQAALHDHMKYLNKKKAAEEMEQQFHNTSSVDYSLKEGETLCLQIKNKSSGRVKSKFFEQGPNSPSSEDKGNQKEPLICIKPPPPPSATVSASTTAQNSPSNSPQSLSPGATSKFEVQDSTTEDQTTEDIPDDDFGDFQAAG